MITALMISRSRETFADIEPVMTLENIQTEWCGSGQDAITILQQKKFDLVILENTLPDMTGKQFVNKLVGLDPMAGCAVAGSLSKDEFHETYEGCGVMMQLSPIPDPDEIRELIEQFKKIKLLSPIRIRSH